VELDCTGMQEIQTKVNSTTIMRLVLGGKEWHRGEAFAIGGALQRVA